MDWPNCEPGSSPTGAAALTRSPQQAQRPPNRRTCVTSGLMGRQLDALVDLLRGLRGLWEGRLAFRTGSQPGIDHTIRVRMQRAADAGPALAGRAIGWWAILLLTLRGRLGRVVGCLRRAGQCV